MPDPVVLGINTRPLIRGTDGIIAPPPPIKFNDDGTINVQSVVTLNQVISDLIKHINSGLSTGNGTDGGQTGNTQNQWLSFVTPSVADTEFELPHGLQRTPVGFATYFVDAAAIVYISNYGSWTNKRILLKCDSVSTSCVILLA